MFILLSVLFRWTFTNHIFPGSLWRRYEEDWQGKRGGKTKGSNTASSLSSHRFHPRRSEQVIALLLRCFCQQVYGPPRISVRTSKGGTRILKKEVCVVMDEGSKSARMHHLRNTTKHHRFSRCCGSSFFFFYGIVLPTAWQAGLIAFSAIREVIFATLRDELSSATIELVEQGYLLVVLT